MVSIATGLITDRVWRHASAMHPAVRSSTVALFAARELSEDLGNADPRRTVVWARRLEQIAVGHDVHAVIAGSLDITEKLAGLSIHADQPAR